MACATIASLPRTVLERVLLLALPVDVEHVVRGPVEIHTKDRYKAATGHGLPLREMQSLALVSRDWCASMTRVYHRCAHRVASVVVARREVCVKHADGTCSVNPTAIDICVEVLRVTIKDKPRGQLWTCDWDRVFKLFPIVRRLDLSKVSVHSRHLPALLLAASTHCGHVESLLLTCEGGADSAQEGGKQEDLGESKEDETATAEQVVLFGNKVRSGRHQDAVFGALYAALERWYAVGDGLRHLAVLERLGLDRVHDNDVFMDAITRYCPQIEFLETTSAWWTIRGNLMCDLAIWEQFCRACVSLRAFDWVTVPFTNPYLLPFAATKKPRLHSLFLGYREHDRGFPIDPLLVSPTALHSLFSALPALEQLMFSSAAQPSDRFYALVTLLTDDLVATIVACCPRLRYLEWAFRALGDVDEADKVALNQFTDASLVRLVTLPFFEVLHMPFSMTACTEEGLLAVARSNRSTRSLTRHFNFHLDPTGERGSVLEFLHGVLEDDADLFAGPRLDLVLTTTIDEDGKRFRQLQKQLKLRNVDATVYPPAMNGPSGLAVRVRPSWRLSEYERRRR